MNFRLVLTLAVISLQTGLSGADWPQWMGPDRAGIWETSGIRESFPKDGPPVMWRVPIGGGYAGPAVSEERVFVMDRFHEEGSTGEGGIPGTERLLCLEATTGKILWKHEWPARYTFDYPSGPRATPTVHEGMVFALGAEGHLFCFDEVEGKILWQKDLPKEYNCTPPTWGYAGHPLIYKDLLLCVVGGEGSTCVAFDKRTGEEKWRALSSKQAGYCPPALVPHGEKQALIVWHGEAVNALDPDSGSVFWTIPRETRYGVSMAGPVSSGDRILISAFWWGSLMLDWKPGTKEPDVAWRTETESDRDTTHLNALMCTPILVDGFLYGVCSYGQLRCLEWKTGERRWETFAATTGDKEDRWANAFLTRIGKEGNRFILFNEKGELILADLTPEGYKEISRAAVIEPNGRDVRQRPIVWTHPAYAGTKVYVRNDTEIICLDLAAE